jgi:hypothetical protein
MRNLTRSKRQNFSLKCTTIVADARCLSRIRIFPSRIQGQKDAGAIKDLLTPKKMVSKPVLRIRIRDPGLGFDPGIRNRFIPDPGSRIPDPKLIFLRA